MPMEPAQLLAESRQRRSCRRFSAESVSMEDIKTCLLTAVTAPNGANKQPWHFTVITDPAMKKELRAACEKVERAFYEQKASEHWKGDLKKLSTDASKPFLEEAPCIIAVFRVNYFLRPDGTRDANYYVTESACLATGLLINALRNAGYDTLTYTPAPMQFVAELLHRPEGEVPVMLLCVGHRHPDWTPPQLGRKPLEEFADFICVNAEVIL